MHEILMLILAFLQIGILGIGGGYAMLPLIFQRVQDFGFMSVPEFANLVAISQVTPGPVAINAATYVGYYVSGLAGAAVATAVLCLPSLVLTWLVARFLDRFKENRITQSVMSGLRPVSVGLVATAVIYIGEASLFSRGFSVGNILEAGPAFFQPIPLAIFAVAILLHGRFKASPIAIILGAGLLGAFVL
jgi:chromate transporter